MYINTGNVKNSNGAVSQYHNNFQLIYADNYQLQNMLADDINVLKKMDVHRRQFIQSSMRQQAPLNSCCNQYNQNFYLTSSGNCLSTAIPANRNNRILHQ